MQHNLFLYRLLEDLSNIDAPTYRPEEKEISNFHDPDITNSPDNNNVDILESTPT